MANDTDKNGPENTIKVTHVIDSINNHQNKNKNKNKLHGYKYYHLSQNTKA